MECPDFMELISVRQDGELSPVEERQLDKHLAVCSNCRQFQQELISLKQTMTDTTREKLPRETEQLILKKTIDKVSVISKLLGVGGGYYRIPRGVAWAAAIIIISLLGATIAGRIGSGPRAPINTENLPVSVMVQQVELTKGDLVEFQTISAKGPRH